MTGKTSRRAFARSLLEAASAVLAAPALVRAAVTAPSIAMGARPLVEHGVASGDVSFDSAIVWSRADRPSRLVVEWSTTDSFADKRRVVGPVVDAKTDFTGKVSLRRLPPGQRIVYRVQFQDRGGEKAVSEPVTGQFVTAARDRRDVVLAWSGDTCGQGYGIDESRGGLLTYESIRAVRPDFFIHSGDTIYADGPLKPEVKLPNGEIWKNLVTPEKSKVAETLAEFRGNHRYNLLDRNVRAFNAEVSVCAQWDDHEVRNNWYPGQRLTDGAYGVKDVDVLARHARQAFYEYWPIDSRRIFRQICRGPLCDVFLLDLRSFRGPNTPNRQPQAGPETAFMGGKQLRWLMQALRKSKALWKIIASDMPIGLIVGDGKNFENCANGNGPALGRELEIAELLRFIRRERIANVIWLTADVHYAASNHYDPTRAQFADFQPFWEFVSGPLHAASLAPGSVDNTFGPQMRYSSRPKGAPASGPYTPEQYFGVVHLDGKTGVATVSHHNRDGAPLWKIDLEAM